jgi:hypothetical protein
MQHLVVAPCAVGGHRQMAELSNADLWVKISAKAGVQGGRYSLGLGFPLSRAFAGMMNNLLIRFHFGLGSEKKERLMPRFLIERNFAEEVEVTKDVADNIQRINDDEGVKWLFSFLSPDKRKTYCLYEAPSAEAIRIAARRANLPADVVIEVSELRPEMFA